MFKVLAYGVCGRLNWCHRCSDPNLCNLWMSYMAKGFAGMAKLNTLTLSWVGLSSACNHKCPSKREAGKIWLWKGRRGIWWLCLIGALCFDSGRGVQVKEYRRSLVPEKGRKAESPFRARENNLASILMLT